MKVIYNLWMMVDADAEVFTGRMFRVVQKPQYFADVLYGYAEYIDKSSRINFVSKMK